MRTAQNPIKTYDFTLTRLITHARAWPFTKTIFSHCLHPTSNFQNECHRTKKEYTHETHSLKSHSPRASSSRPISLISRSRACSAAFSRGDESFLSGLAEICVTFCSPERAHVHGHGPVAGVVVVRSERNAD